MVLDPKWTEGQSCAYAEWIEYIAKETMGCALGSLSEFRIPNQIHSTV